MDHQPKKVTVKVGGVNVVVEIPSMAELVSNIRETEKLVAKERKPRTKGRVHGEDTTLTNQMVYSVWDCTEHLVHFVAGIGATEQLVDRLLEEGHELREFKNRKERATCWKLVAGPQIAYDYYWEPTDDFTIAVIEENVRYAKSVINKNKVRIRVFKAAPESADDDDDMDKPEKGFGGFWSNLAWREVQNINLLKAAGYKEPIRLNTESVLDFLLSANIVPKGMETEKLANAVLRAIAGVLADYSIFPYPDNPNLYGDSEEMLAYLGWDELLAKLPVPIPQKAEYWELVDIMSRNAAIEKP
jgi:hypothetical protein